MQYPPVIFHIKLDIPDHGDTGNVMDNILREIEKFSSKFVDFAGYAAHAFRDPSSSSSAYMTWQLFRTDVNTNICAGGGKYESSNRLEGGGRGEQEKAVKGRLPFTA